LWPKPLTDEQLLHRKWLKLESDQPGHMKVYHTEIICFQRALKSLQKRRTDQVRAVTRIILLPFAVETHIVSQYPLGWDDDWMRAVYIRLRGVVEAYEVVDNSTAFELV